MDFARRQVVAYAIIGFLITATVVGAAVHINGTLQNDGVPVQSDDGMTVTVEGSPQMDLSEFAGALGGTVYITTESGNATFYSSGEASATVHKDEITGPWTNVTAIEADPNSIQIDPADKAQVTVGQEITSISFTGSYTADDGAADFVYSASGPGEVTLTNAPASTTLYAVDGDDGEILDVADSDSGGSVTFDALASGDHDVVLQTGVNNAPVLSDPSPEGDLSEEPTQFSVDVGDANFDQGDSVDVTIDYEGSQIHSETVSSNQTVTVSAPAGAGDGGGHQWSVSATDDFGGQTDATYNYNVPSDITFRAEQPGHGVIQDATNPITIQATFYEDAETDPTIINRTTTDGTIDLDGLPVSSEFSVSVSAPGYHNRTVRLENIYQQNTIFLIEKGAATTVENRFVVNDRTGEFPPSETEIAIQAAVNESLYESGSPGFDWLTVSGDDLGADQAYVDDLIEGKRYRAVVENSDGDTRVLGAYTPETAGTIQLNIGSVTVNPEETGGVGLNATWYNESGSENVRIEYNDSAGATETLYVDVYERNNESNTLVDNESFSGPFGTFSHTEPVPDGEEETTWVVEVRGDRGTNADGETAENVHFQEFVGPGMPVLTDLPQWLVTVIFVGLIFAVAGLFSQVNGHVGGIVVAGLGAMLFFVGLVPGALGGGVVALSLLVAGILFMRGSRGGL